MQKQAAMVNLSLLPIQTIQAKPTQWTIENEDHMGSSYGWIVLQ